MCLMCRHILMFMHYVCDLARVSYGERITKKGVLKMVTVGSTVIRSEAGEHCCNPPAYFMRISCSTITGLRDLLCDTCTQ